MVWADPYIYIAWSFEPDIAKLSPKFDLDHTTSYNPSSVVFIHPMEQEVQHIAGGSYHLMLGT